MSPLWFPREEYDSRFKVLRARLDVLKLDALLLSWDTNLRYYTGFRQMTAILSPARYTVVLLPRVGDPVLFTHAFREVDARTSVWFQDVRPHTSLLGAPIEEIAAEIRSRGVRRLAAELGQEQRIGMPVTDFLSLRQELAGTEWVDAAEVIWPQRIRKSPAELEYLRQAGHATARAYESVYPEVQVGMSEREVSRLLKGAMLDAGADDGPFMVMASGEGNYGRLGGMATDRRLQRGDMLWVDMGARVNDYCADFSRAGVIGGPTDRQKRMQELVIAVTARGVEQAVPGAPVSNIARACNEEMKRRGQEITFVAGRVGHGLGMNTTEPPHVALYDPTRLEPGMVITVEPGVVEPYGVFHVEENVIITGSGHEVISTASRELWDMRC